jgi:chitodextrinase
LFPLRFDRCRPALSLAAGILVALAASAAIASPVIRAPLAVSGGARGGSTPAGHAGVHTSADVAKVQDETGQLVSLGQAYLNTATPSSTLRDRLWQLAEARQQTLRDLMRTDDQAAADAVLSNPQVAALRGIKGLPVETKVSVSGRFATVHQDSFQHGPAVAGSGYLPELIAGNTAYSLYGDRNFSQLKANQPVTVQGYQVRNQILVMGSTGGTVTPGTASQPAPILGAYDVAVMVAYFSDTTNPFTMSQIQGAFNGSPGLDVESFYSQVSYGQASIAPSFYGAYQLSITQASGCANPSYASSVLMQQASSSVTYANFKSFVYVLDCTNFADQASVGPGALSTPQGTVTAGTAWINLTSDAAPFTYTHELGHNMGLYHANFWECPPPKQFDTAGCANLNYGDEYDTMGQPPAGMQAGFDAWHRYVVGWLNSTTMPTVSQAGTYTYTLAPIESTSPTGPVALYIPRGNTGSGFSVEYRQPSGVDSWMQGSNVTAGASIKWVGSMMSNADSEALDSTPSSQVSNSYWNTADFSQDGAFLPGASFTDGSYGITVKVLGASSSGLTVQVTLAQTCTLAASTVAVSPSSQTATTAGATLTYTVTVTDADSAGCSNHAYHFNAQGTGNWSGPYGGPWQMYTSQGDLTLGPGQSGSWTLNVTASPSASDGAYAFSSVAPFVMSSEGSFTAAIPFTYVLSTPADSTPPTAPGSLTASATGAAVVNLAWTASTDNVGVAGYRLFRNGSDITPYTPITSPSFTDHAVAPGMSYSYDVEAFDSKANLSAASSAVTLTTPPKTDTTAPSAPANLTVTAGDHNATASWTASTDNVGVAGYFVSSPAGLQRIPAGTTSLTAGDLQSSSPAAFVVAAFDADGNLSPFAQTNDIHGSTTFTAYTAAPGTSSPTQPAGLTGTLVTSSGAPYVSLSWTASSDPTGVTSYLVYRDTIPLFSTTSTSFNDSSVVAGGYYQYEVQALDAAGNKSPLSGVVSLSGPGYGSSTPIAVLSQPVSGATLSGTPMVAASGTDSGGVVQVEYYLDGVLWGSSISSTHSFAFNTAYLSGGPHTLGARAIDTSLNQASSSNISVTISNSGGTDTTPPTAPSGLTASAVSASQINLAWSASTDNVGVAGYYVFRDASQVASAASTSYADSGLTAATGHSYSVKAYDAAGNVSVASTSASATTQAADTTPPTAPSNVAASVIDSAQVNLSWSASTDNVGVAGYEIFRNGSRIGSTTTTGFADTTVAASTKYSYYVEAFDAAGNVSAASSQVSASTRALSGALSGVVSSAQSGLGLNGASVTAKAKGVSRTVHTDAAGGYTIPCLAPGTYQVTYSASGYASVQVTITVVGGQTTTEKLALS